MSARTLSLIIGILSSVLATIGYVKNIYPIFEFFSCLAIVMFMLAPACEGSDPKKRLRRKIQRQLKKAKREREAILSIGVDKMKYNQYDDRMLLNMYFDADAQVKKLKRDLEL
ncbi:MAG: hypothetical protein GTO02_17785 [Candidatus Dadabacteria bacterium]|nr:hypothetical protein [Candidatus Dadabacteria bacterium]